MQSQGNATEVLKELRQVPVFFEEVVELIANGLPKKKCGAFWNIQIRSLNIGGSLVIE